jgi:predicted metal-binding membrane protein
MARRPDITALGRLLRRDRAVTLAALLAAAALAWAYLVSGAGMSGAPPAMPDMPGMSMSGMSMSGMSMRATWTASYFAVIAAMWVIMMVAMMLPSAAPMVLLFATIERRRRAASPFPATAWFALAYVLLWAAIGLLGVLLQWQLDRLALLSPAIAVTSAAIAGVVLIAAGLYQFTPLKQACLHGCRSPLEFISQYWNRGPFGLGLTHGLYCIGCCWMLMLLLFVGGVMNLLWVAAIALFVLIEKMAPRGRWIAYAAGVALIVAGAWQFAAAMRL